jgi:hypothetical protein
MAEPFSFTRSADKKPLPTKLWSFPRFLIFNLTFQKLNPRQDYQILSSEIQSI